METTQIPQSRLSAALTMGSVHLKVQNLDRSLEFYQRVTGLKVHDRSDGRAELGVGGATLLALTEHPNARIVRNRTGLYHFAILTPSRLALAQALYTLIETQTRFGGSDHIVSEALYLSDPDGNGIEIYRDRPRAGWLWQDGRVHMETDPLDYPDILAELKQNPQPWDGLDSGTVIGHVHLHIANQRQSDLFYEQVLGFSRTATMPGASFYAAGGYHHHLGANTWAGMGAPPPPADAVGLEHFVVNLPNSNEIAGLIQRLEAHEVPFEHRSDGLFVRDPSANGIVFVAAESH